MFVDIIGKESVQTAEFVYVEQERFSLQYFIDKPEEETKLSPVGKRITAVARRPETDDEP
jgi:hypothetical protein